MKIILIAAAAENNVIGQGGKIPWDLPDDLKHFRKLTEGHAVIMGRKTLDSLEKPLPKRRNIVITHDDHIFGGCEVVHSLGEALKICKSESELWIIGGGEIYREALTKADRIELTRVHATVKGDAFFPDVDWSNWQLTMENRHESNENHAYAFTFQTYERIISE